MADSIKKGDFFELDYIGRTSEGELFDTTKKEVADKEGLHIHREFKPAIVCSGEGHLLPGLDQKLIGKNVGTHTIELKDIEAFGKKNAKLLQLIPRKVFKEQNVEPQIGLEINVDNQKGIIRSVSGGRVIVDFNHPLSSKDISYEIDIKRIVTDKKEKLEALLGLIGLPVAALKVEGEKAEITLIQELPENIVDIFTKDIVRLTGLTDVLFKADKKGEKESKKPE